MGAEPNTGINRQRSRRLDASAERYAAKGARRGDDGRGRASEPTTATPESQAWPEILVATGAAKIDGMKGRYTGTLFGLSINAAATGDLSVANLGVAYGTCEIWHAPDIDADEPLLKASDVLYVTREKRHSTRDKMIVVTIAGRTTADEDDVGGSGAVMRMKVTAVSSTTITAKSWDGTTLGSAVTVLPIQGHAVNDIIYAALSLTGTSESAAEWLEIFSPAKASQYKVVSVVDTTGRLGLDYVRAH